MGSRGEGEGEEDEMEENGEEGGMVVVVGVTKLRISSLQMLRRPVIDTLKGK